MRALGPALAALIAGWVGACANQGAPPGGPEDRRPPVVVRTEPDTFATLTDLDSRVRFYFDERISESVSNGTLDNAVTVSPLTGEVHVDHDSRSLSVEVRGGFRPGLVYRVTLLPVVSDLFGNQMRDPFELVFSTGGTASPTTLAGQVWDRITGQGVDGAVVHAVADDSLVYVATSDAQGIFAFRYLPSGTFTLTGFEDRDRNGEVGDGEAQGHVAASVAPADTAVIDIPVLPPDTTAAKALRASALDSLTVVVEFDDYLEPGQESEGIGVTLSREDGPAPGVARVLLEGEYGAYVGQVTDSLMRLDSIDAARRAPRAPRVSPLDSAALASDTTTVAVPDTLAGGPGAPGGAAEPPRRRAPPRLPGPARGGRGGASTSTPGRVLPGRRVVALLDGPVRVDVAYQVDVSSVENINGLGGGGGSVTLLRQAPAPADSTAAPAQPDSASAGVPLTPAPNR